MVNIKQKVISKIAESMVITIDEAPYEAHINKPLSECKVAFVTTSGVHLKSQEPFNVKGDTTYRVIPGDVDFQDLTVTHTHYEITDAMENKNIVFPLEHLREFKDKGIISEVNHRNYGLMGYMPDTKKVMSVTAVEIADQLEQDGVDIVLMSPG